MQVSLWDSPSFLTTDSNSVSFWPSVPTQRNWNICIYYFKFSLNNLLSLPVQLTVRMRKTITTSGLIIAAAFSLCLVWFSAGLKFFHTHVECKLGQILHSLLALEKKKNTTYLDSLHTFDFDYCLRVFLDILFKLIISYVPAPPQHFY